MTESNESLSVEARASRHIVGRVLRGCGLQSAFGKLVDEHGLRTAWVSAIGAFEWVELTEYSQTDRRYQEAHRFEHCEILSMQGNLSERDGEPFWHFHATISLREGGRDVTYGGHVVDGSVFALEFRVDCFDETELKRVDDSATGLQLWASMEALQSAGKQARGPEAAAADVTWAMAAEVSTRAQPGAREKDEPRKGDWIEHAKFGLCKIEGLSGDGVCFIKLPDARRKKIKISAMSVLAPREDGGRRVFAVRPKPKG